MGTFQLFLLNDQPVICTANTVPRKFARMQVQDTADENLKKKGKVPHIATTKKDKPTNKNSVAYVLFGRMPKKMWKIGPIDISVSVFAKTELLVLKFRRRQWFTTRQPFQRHVYTIGCSICGNSLLWLSLSVSRVCCNVMSDKGLLSTDLISLIRIHSIDCFEWCLEYSREVYLKELVKMVKFVQLKSQ